MDISSCPDLKGLDRVGGWSFVLSTVWVLAVTVIHSVIFTLVVSFSNVVFASYPQVYRRGVHAIPLSVDLWLHYLSFIKDNADPEDPETPSRIRA